MKADGFAVVSAPNLVKPQWGMEPRNVTKWLSVNADNESDIGLLGEPIKKQLKGGG